MRSILSKNPFTGEIRKQVEFISSEQLLKKIKYS